MRSAELMRKSVSIKYKSRLVYAIALNLERKRLLLPLLQETTLLGS